MMIQEAQRLAKYAKKANLVMKEKNARNAQLARFKTIRAKQAAKSVCQGPIPIQDGVHAKDAILGSSA